MNLNDHYKRLNRQPKTPDPDGFTVDHLPPREAAKALWAEHAAGRLRRRDAAVEVPALWYRAGMPSALLSTDQWLALWRLAGPYGEIPREPVQAWRGATPAGKRGFSWNTYRGYAGAYASRQRGGRLYRADAIPPRAILAVFDDPDNYQIVVNPRIPFEIVEEQRGTFDKRRAEERERRQDEQRQRERLRERQQERRRKAAREARRREQARAQRRKEARQRRREERRKDPEVQAQAAARAAETRRAIAARQARATDAEIAAIGSESRAFLAAAPPAPAVEPYVPRSHEEIMADLRAAAADVWPR